MTNLVIVESPAKAKTISGYLGNGYKVLSSYGHIRDLPKTKLGVEVDDDFEPNYRILPQAGKQVKKIKKAYSQADNLILATDLDREGEAIAWHLIKALGLKENSKKVKRVTFDEVTKSAIKKAIDNPRGIDQDLVDAQQARRVLDRLVGYKLSPMLWKKIARGLSAGRVQSVAVRLVVEREREIENFKPKKYWRIKGLFSKDKTKFEGKLFKQKRDKGWKKLKKLEIDSQKKADKIKKELKDKDYKVKKVEEKERKRHPYPPYTTATLQRDAAYRLKFSAKKTMYLAQKLYEGLKIGKGKPEGLITYMRTDSLNLSKQAVKQARSFIKSNYKSDLPDKANFYKSKKGAQEAHEAIRPTNPGRAPEAIKKYLDKDLFKLYQLIWQRMIACQMKPIKYRQIKAEIKAGNYLFLAKGRAMTDKGFSKVYQVKFKESAIPKLKKEQSVELKKLKIDQKETQPPKRYSESGLVKELEKRGIGRPSTYAPTISTIQKRNYVEKVKGYFQPTEIGEIVNDLLVKHFPKVVDYQFTADLEEKLDKIAKGDKEWKKVIKNFYSPFEKKLKEAKQKLKKEEIAEEKIGEKCPECGEQLIKKIGKYGKFIACSNYPDCKYSRPIKDGKKKKKKQKLTKKEKELAQKTLAKNPKCDKCGADMEIKKGRYGIFLGCSKFPDCKNMVNIDVKTGQKCPECGGDVVIKRTRKGKKFWGCSNYPKCRWASWTDPAKEKEKK